MSKGFNFVVKLHIYPFEVMVSVDESDDVLLKRLSNYGLSKNDCNELIELHETVKARCVMLETNHTIIRLKTG
jgi:hypothetical protein